MANLPAITGFVTQITISPQNLVQYPVRQYREKSTEYRIRILYTQLRRASDLYL
jgi:hypothetical protein